MAPPYSIQIVSKPQKEETIVSLDGGHLKKHDPTVEKNYSLTMPEEKNDLTKPNPVTDAVDVGKVVNAEDEIFSLENLFLEEQSSERKEVKKKRKKKRWKRINSDPKAHKETTRTWKVKISVFNGENAESWVPRVENYFELGKLSETKKPQAVHTSVKNDALRRYQGKRDHNPFLSWEHTKMQVLEKLATIHDATAGERLLTLSHEDTVKIFGRDLISLTTSKLEQAEHGWEKAFMIGLKVKMRRGVKRLEPRNLKQLMIVAQMEEQWAMTAVTPSEIENGGEGELTQLGQNQHMGQLFQTDTHNGPGSFNKRPKRSSPLDKQTYVRYDFQIPNSDSQLKPPFRKLTTAEIVKWKTKKLCFRCDDKWLTHHKCSDKELMLLLLQEGENGKEWDKDFEERTEEYVEDISEIRSFPSICWLGYHLLRP